MIITNKMRLVLTISILYLHFTIIYNLRNDNRTIISIIVPSIHECLQPKRQSVMLVAEATIFT